MATPALRAIRAHFRDAALTFLGRRTSLELLDGSTWSDDALADTSQQRPRFRNLLRLGKLLRRRGHDMVILMPNSFRTGVLAWLSRAKRTAGYSRHGRGWLLTDAIKPPRDERGRVAIVNAIDYYRTLAQSLGVPCESRRMELPVRAEDSRTAAELLAQAQADPERPLIMLNPGASFGPSKMWAPARFAQAADWLVQERSAQIIVNAAPAEREIAAEVERHMKLPPLVSFANRDNSIGLLKGLMARCDLLITNDTGPRHIAAALGVPVVTIFGSTEPERARIDFPMERMVRVAVSCSPCQQKLCPQTPGPRYHQCMDLITPAMVVSEATALLDASAMSAGTAQ